MNINELTEEEAIKELEQVARNYKLEVSNMPKKYQREIFQRVVTDRIFSSQQHLLVIYRANMALGKGLSKLEKYLGQKGYEFWCEGVNRHITDIQRIILEDCKELCLENEKDESYCIYFNNFHLNLPGGGRKEHAEEAGILDLQKCRGNKTIGQFYQDLNLVMQQYGFDEQEIREMQPSAKLNISIRRKLLENALPIFVALRMRGYTKEELCF